MDLKKKYPNPNLWLPSETKEKYEVVDWQGGNKQVFGKHGTINLKTLSVKQAARLVKAEFPKLKEKEGVSAESAALENDNAAGQSAGNKKKK